MNSQVEDIMPPASLDWWKHTNVILVVRITTHVLLADYVTTGNG